MDKFNQYGTLKMQEYLLPIMKDIDQICRENAIKYTIADGTLLGAVRHGGFIPWDDDVDVAFDRKNYKCFLEVLDKKLPKEYTVVYDMWIRRITRKDNPGICNNPPEGCIDLFVFDNVPENAWTRRIQAFLLKTLQGMMKTKVKYEGFSIFYKVLLFCTLVMGKCINMKTKQRWYEIVSQWGNKKETTYINRFDDLYKNISSMRHKSEIISEYTEIEFEGISFMALKKWNDFLTDYYGDYMKLPPDEERHPQHI